MQLHKLILISIVFSLLITASTCAPIQPAHQRTSATLADLAHRQQPRETSELPKAMAEAPTVDRVDFDNAWTDAAKTAKRPEAQSAKAAYSVVDYHKNSDGSLIMYLYLTESITSEAAEVIARREIEKVISQRRPSYVVQMFCWLKRPGHPDGNKQIYMEDGSPSIRYYPRTGQD